jgi:hypothetical protein
MIVTSFKPAAHERTCLAYLLFVTSWIDKLAELKTTWLIKITSSCLFFNSASCAHEQIFLFRRACRLLAAHENFFVMNDEKYQTCLIFGLHVTNDENAVNVAPHEDILSIQLVTNNKYARQVRSCAAGFTLNLNPQYLNTLFVYILGILFKFFKFVYVIAWGRVKLRVNFMCFQSLTNNKLPKAMSLLCWSE